MGRESVCIHFTQAVLRTPGVNFAAGISGSSEGSPIVSKALIQHAEYAHALRSLGLALTVLSPDERYPDGPFVEDTAIVTSKDAVITRPGAISRAGEIDEIERTLGTMLSLSHIGEPGTVDGGDICETDDVILIAISERTNEAGAGQLVRLLGALGHRTELVDIRGIPALLHLKTGVSYLGDGRVAVAPAASALVALRGFERVVLKPSESYAANCIRINDRVLVAAGYPHFAESLDRLGYSPLQLEMSEFRKMDGGLSCLSLRF